MKDIHIVYDEDTRENLSAFETNRDALTYARHLDQKADEERFFIDTVTLYGPGEYTAVNDARSAINTSDALLSRIVGELTGIAKDDMSTAEKNIARAFCEADLMRYDKVRETFERCKKS